MKSKIPVFISSILFCFTQISSGQVTYHVTGSLGNEQNNKFYKSKPQALDVIEYQLDLHIYPELRSISGKMDVLIHTLDYISDSLVLDFADLAADSVFIAGQSVKYDSHSECLYIFPLTQIMPGDSVLLTVYYHGTPQKGLYFRENTYGDTVIYSHSEPYDARYWFPCKDNPSDKAKFLMQLYLPQKYISLSNGVLLEEHSIDNNRKLSVWQENYPIATYLISIAASNYMIIENEYLWQGISMPLQYYVYPSDRKRGENALEMTTNILDYFNTYIGVYSFHAEKYAMSTVPFREAAAMENQTATTMRDNIMDNENVIAHELAHQWWGDALTPNSFAHIWLNEGFASYFDVLYTEFQYGTDAFHKRMAEYKSSIIQDPSLEYPVFDPPEQFLFGRAVYYKGAWILHMLRNLIGNDTFRQIHQNYFSLYEYKNVQTDEYIQLCENISGRNLDSFFNQWLYYGGIPELFVDWEQENNLLTLRLEQVQADPVYHFDVSVKLTGTKNDTTFVLPINSRSNTVQFFYPDYVTKVEIDPENKILQTNNTPLYYIPKTTNLIRLYPNPFNNELTIEFGTERSQEVTIEIWDINGRRVTTLTSRLWNAGLHTLSWQGNKQASGTYFCVLKTQKQTVVRKVVLLH